MNRKKTNALGVRGYPGKSDKGELSIIPKELFLLSPCIPPLPREWQTLSNDNIVYRQVCFIRRKE